MKIQKIFSGLLCLLTVSCFSWFSDFSQSKRKLSRGECSESFKYFSYLRNLNEKQRAFALKAGRVCEDKDLQAALLFYEKWLKETEAFSVEARAVKKTLAHLSFYKARNYEKAAFYYARLLSEGSSSEERFYNQYGLAEAFFKLKKYSQSLLEVEKILQQKNLVPKKEQKALQLKGSLLMALKDYKKATEFFTLQAERFPEKAGFFRKYLALIFETQGRYQLAIEELKKISDPSAEEKIKALTRQITRQPKGFL